MQMLAAIKSLVKEHMDKTFVMIFVVPKKGEMEKMYDEKFAKICGKKIVLKVIDKVIAATRARAE